MIKGVRLFLRFVNYYYIFIKGFNNLAALLIKFIKKGARFNWTDKYEKGYQNSKKAFIKGPILVIFNYKRDTRVKPNILG